MITGTFTLWTKRRGVGGSAGPGASLPRGDGELPGSEGFSGRGRRQRGSPERTPGHLPACCPRFSQMHRRPVQSQRWGKLSYKTGTPKWLYPTVEVNQRDPVLYPQRTQEQLAFSNLGGERKRGDHSLLTAGNSRLSPALRQAGGPTDPPAET